MNRCRSSGVRIGFPAIFKYNYSLAEMYQYTRGYANGSCLNRAASGAQLPVVIAYSATVALGVAPHGLVFSFW